MRRAHWIAAAAFLIAPQLAGAQTASPAEDAAEPAAPAMVDPMADLTAEERFMLLHGTVVAYERCTGESFDETQAVAINGRIREVVGESFGAGRTLEMIFEAKQAMNRTLSTRGCSSDPVAAALSLFQAEIAPALLAPADGG